MHVTSAKEPYVPTDNGHAPLSATVESVLMTARHDKDYSSARTSHVPSPQSQVTAKELGSLGTSDHEITIHGVVVSIPRALESIAPEVLYWMYQNSKGTDVCTPESATA
jgi:hypothetical protein